MAFDDLVFKSKAQAEKLREVFADRYGKKLGNKKWEEVASRSPKMEDLPERTPRAYNPSPKRKINVSRRFSKRWRGF